jgi:hypothetical protein
MPVVYTIDATRKFIHTECIGNIALAEVLDHFQTLVNDPTCPDWLHVLLDLSAVSSIPEPHQLRQVSYKIGSITDSVRFGACAIVAPKDAMFGMSRMFEVYAEKWFKAIRVFRAIDEAKEWLNGEMARITQESST